MTNHYVDEEYGLFRINHPFDVVYDAHTIYRVVNDDGLALLEITAPMEQVDFVETTHITVVCKNCGSDDVTKYGFKNGVQQYWCKKCKRKFVANNALPGMRIPPDQIASALANYYEGLSLNAIRRRMDDEYGFMPSDATIYEWVVRFTNQAVDALEGIQVHASHAWIMDETVLEVRGKNHWFWDVIDDETRFLLGSHFSLTRTKNDAVTMLRQAQAIAVNPPKVIYSDGLRSYPDAVDLVFGSDSKHQRSSPFVEDGMTTNLIERFHGTIKQRTKVMRGMHNLTTASIVMNGWLVHYNFFRPHESLRDRTPAQIARANYPFKSWRDVVTHGHIPSYKKITERVEV